jgi:diguanylate cyclase (GGDEF)-like protein
MADPYLTSPFSERSLRFLPRRFWKGPDRRTAASADPDGDIDALTGLPGAASFLEAATGALSQGDEGLATRSTRRPLSILLVRIDDLHTIEDAWGDETARQAVRYCASSLARRVPAGGVIGRISPNCFAALLKGHDASLARAAEADLRADIADKPFVFRNADGLSGAVSLTVATATDRPGDTSEALLTRAQARLTACRLTGVRFRGEMSRPYPRM